MQAVMMPVAGVLFVAAWAVGVAGFILSLVEQVGVWRLREWAFRCGPVAVIDEEPGGCPQGLAGTSGGETAAMKYVVLEGQRCLFRRRIKGFEFRIHTPLEVKGEVSWKKGRLTTTGRFPLGILLFFGGWLAGWSVGGLTFVLDGQWGGILFLLGGWLFGGGMLVLSRWLELKRFRRRAAEVKSLLMGVPAQQ